MNGAAAGTPVIAGCVPGARAGFLATRAVR